MTAEAAATAGVTVVATTTQAADLARAVAGDRAEVVGLLPANADPHDYEIRPDDVKALARAELVVRSGGELDEWLGSAIESSGTDAPTLSLIDHVDTRERDGDVDPHWWQDPRNAVRAVAAIEAALTRADPGGARGLRAGARAYSGRIERLDAAVADCLGRLAPAQRKLVTTHDALGYYARALRPRGDRRRHPVALDAGPGLRGRGDAARRHDPARGRARRSSPRARSTRRSSGSSPTRPARASAGRSTPTRSGREDSDGATYLGSIAANTRARSPTGSAAATLSCAPPD